MSVESAKAFYERVATDEAFQKQLRDAGSNNQRLKIIQAAGYSFTSQEWEITLAEISRLDDSKLSDAQLEAIAGGVGTVAQEQVWFNYQLPQRIWSGLKPSTNSIKQLHGLFYPPGWSIKTKLSVALLSVALIPMSLTSYNNLQQNLNSATDSEYRKLELLATSNASRLDQLLLDIQRVAVQVSTDKDVIRFLASVPEKQIDLRSSMERSLDNIFRSNPDYDVVYIVDKNGQCQGATDPTFIGQNYAFREYFQKALLGRSNVSSILLGATSGRPGIYFSNPVRSENGDIIGVAVLKIKGEDIWAIVNKLQAGSQSYAFLIDENGVIISHFDKSLLYHSLTRLPPDKLRAIASDRRYGLKQIQSLDIPELAKSMLGAKESGHTSYYLPHDQTHQILGFAPLEQEPWVLGVNKPIEQFTAPLNNLIWDNSRNLLAVGAIVTIIALLLARSIAKPIHALTNAAQAMFEQNDFDPQELAQAAGGTDDIAQLVRVFLQMAEDVKQREQSLKQQVMELHIEIDEVKKARHVAEITQTDYFQQIQKKARKLKERSQQVSETETETDYFQQLQIKAQKLKERNIKTE
ncbi:MAG: Nif11-like leader peptide family RiPP precursor [Nostoc sp.]|uniref:Nif11-like leader peptide family RiPP precursor n=1 Tax=Nostoc sp. TaxID=1180 RepID=UPI002FF80925